MSCKWERYSYSVPTNISNSRSFSFTYGHGCCVRRDSPTWNMQQVHQLAFNWLPTIINTVKYKHVVLSIYAYTYSLTYLNTAGERRRQMTSTLFCVPTDELLQAKDLLSEGGQSLSSLTQQVVRLSLQPNRHVFSRL